MTICKITGRAFELKSNGDNHARYCVVSGNGYDAVEFATFHKFCNVVAKPLKISQIISLRTKHFQHSHKHTFTALDHPLLAGFTVEMFYQHNKRKKKR